jgi:hypothetical protein
MTGRGGGKTAVGRERTEEELREREQREEGVDWVWSESNGGSDRVKKKVSTRGSSGSSFERGRGDTCRRREY